MKKMLITLLTLSASLLCVVSLFAEETVKLNANQFIIDTTNSMILTNANIDEINSKVKSKISRIELDKTWRLSQEVERLEVGKEYFVFTKENSQDVFSLYFTELPIIHITTNNTIVDEPNVLAKFSMIERNNNYLESFIGIQYRGSFSQTFPKKSMEIEFCTDETMSKTKDYSLLGMTKDDDWNLQALYVESFRSRSKMAFDLWRKINKLHYADLEPKAINGIRNEYSELFVNNEYRGIYAVGEKVNRKQLRLKKYDKTTGTIHGELYKGKGWPNTSFESLMHDYNDSLDTWGGFEYKYPDEKINWSNLYNLVKYVIETPDNEFYNTYATKFDVENLVDFFIFIQTISGDDNISNNLYLAKYDKDSKYFYVPWDLDNILSCAWKEPLLDTVITNGLYDRLIKEKTSGGFWEKAKFKWKTLRDEWMSPELIFNMLKLNFDFLKRNGAYEREQRVWSDYYYDEAYLNDLSEWLAKRINFLDSLFEYKKCNVLAVNSDDFIITNDADFIYIKTNNQDYKVSLYNIFGSLICDEQSFSGNAKLPISSLPIGVYFVIVNDGTSDSFRYHFLN